MADKLKTHQGSSLQHAGSMQSIQSISPHSASTEKLSPQGFLPARILLLSFLTPYPQTSANTEDAALNHKPICCLLFHFPEGL